MGKYANFYDGVRKLLDKIADALDPGAADTKTANYQTAVLNSLSRIGDKVGDVVSATLPDASTATDGDTLVVDDGEWVIGSGGGGGTGGGMVVTISGGETLTMDKTFGEIMTAVTTVPVSFIFIPEQGSDVIVNIFAFLYIANAALVKEISLQLEGETYNFTASTDDDYPSWSE